MKPTRGLVSTAGVVPACRSLDCVSVFAADVETAGTVLSILAGADAIDAFSRDSAQYGLLGERFRVGVPRAAQMQFFGDENSAASWQRALEYMTYLGGQVLETDLAPFQEAADLLYSGPFVAERYAAVGDFLEDRPESEFDPTVRQIILRGAQYSAADVFKAQYRLQELQKAAKAAFQNFDVLFLPTAPSIYKIAEVRESPVKSNSRLGTYTNFVNLLDLCGIAVPAPGRADGLPFGVTLLATAFHDEMLLALAHRWEGSTSGGYLKTEERVLIAVVGAHLTGQPLNWQLTTRGGRFVRAAKTAPKYRLFALRGTNPSKPGLLRSAEQQETGIEIEVWSLSAGAFGSFVAQIPPPLDIGTLQLEDGTNLKGFVCESFATEGAEDITHHGGWRTYVAHSAGLQTK